MPIARLHLTAAATLTVASLALAQEQESADLRRRGYILVASHCSQCHAIERTGDSPNRQALPLRTLGHQYPVESLEEALAEGLSTGHSDMPELVFEPHEINAILAYLQSIQVPKAAPPTTR